MDDGHLLGAGQLMLHAALAALASLRLTLVALVILALAVCAVYLSARLPSTLLAAPFGLLSVNLLAAIVTNRAFRRQSALLVFHLALLALLLLVTASRLSYLSGHVELGDGEEFSGSLIDYEAGPLHPLATLEGLRFTSLGFAIHYAPGPIRQGIRNLIEHPGPGGIPQRQEITDQSPLKLAGYRFYPTSNKGFAPTFTWTPSGGKPQVGSVHLPSYPLYADNQSREWKLPGTQTVALARLDIRQTVLARDTPSEFQPPREHRLELTIGERRWTLRPGESIDLAEGRLTYTALTAWMGYTVFYDWTIPWLLAACLVAIGALGAHFWKKFAAKPWNPAA